MTFRIVPMDTKIVRALRNGAPDANGLPAERTISDGGGNPCRHCLRDIPAGAGMLVLAHRPFSALQPYAECGPVFLCADDCPPWEGTGDELPPVLVDRPSYLVKGYLANERIAYGTGDVVAGHDLAQRIDAIFAREDVVHVDVRSARNNCFQARALRE